MFTTVPASSMKNQTSTVPPSPESLRMEGYSRSRARVTSALFLISGRTVKGVKVGAAARSVVADSLMVGGGGRIKVLESFDTIRVEKSEKELRVYTKGEKNPILSRVFIGDIPFVRLRGLFTKAFSGRRWMVRAERLWPEYFVFSLHLGVDVGGIPVGLGNYVVSLRDLNVPDAHGNLLMVSVGPEGVDAPPGKRSITANTFIPVSNGKTGTTGTRGITGAILEHLSEVLPFLDRSIRVIDEGSCQDRYRSGWNNSDIVYGTTFSFCVGNAILPIVTPMEGLFLACRENFPYLGFEGEILSGMRAAQAVGSRFR